MQKNYALFGLLSLALIGQLTGCSAASTNDTLELGKVNLPTVIEYDVEIQQQAAAEIKADHCPILTSFAVDYGVQRDELRVLHGKDVDVYR